MAPVLGEDFEIHIETATPGTFVMIGAMNSYRRGSGRDEAIRKVFGRSLPYKIPGTRDQTMEVSGFLDLVDAGQIRARACEASQADVTIKVLFDGTANGFTQLVKVRSFSHEAAPEDLQPHGFVFSPQADAVIVGTGPIL
jgi:hypothetical protein